MANNINVNEVNRIAQGSKFIGDIAAVNDIRIDGEFEGRLYCEGRLVVGEKAVLKGDFFCANIDFIGNMTGGNLYVKDTLSLKGGCFVNADLYFQRFQVELGAKFNGRCQVLSEADFEKAAAPVADLLKPGK